MSEVSNLGNLLANAERYAGGVQHCAVSLGKADKIVPLNGACHQHPDALQALANRISPALSS